MQAIALKRRPREFTLENKVARRAQAQAGFGCGDSFSLDLLLRRKFVKADKFAKQYPAAFHRCFYMGPNTYRCLTVPTYTLPLTTVGVAHFVPDPRLPLRYSSMARLVAS